MTLIRKCDRSRNGWNNGDLDVAFQLWRCGMVWDGNLTSKASRDHFVQCGYAIRIAGQQAMTGKGKVAFLMSWVVWCSAWRRWRLWGKNPFIASSNEVQNAIW
jgi:hypothetical protein